MKKQSHSVEPDFRLLFTSLPGLYLVLSPDLRVVALSDAYEAATLQVREQMMGRYIFELFPDNPDAPSTTGTSDLYASLQRVLQHKKPDAMPVLRYDIPRPESEGGGFEERYWSPLNSPVVDADGAVVYIVHRVEDVTDFMRLKQQSQQHDAQAESMRTRFEQMEVEVFQRARQLQEANNKLREAEQIKSEFFTGVSHELRTPLSLIIAPVESMLASSSLSEQHKPLLQTLHSNAIRLLQMVNGLLDFAKSEAGKIEVHREPVELHTLVHSIVADFAPVMQHRGITCSCQLQPEQQFVMIDRYLFERILFNLLSNAVKCTPAGGSIHVRCALRGQYLRLSVADTGVGIPSAARSKLFQKFSQVDASSTRRFEGTGLGLAMTKEFAELLGGTVSVKSTVGKGSVFTVRCMAPPAHPTKLPAAALHNKAPLISPYHQHVHYAPTSEDSLAHGLPRVLVCEDNQELQAYIVSLLRSFCDIRTAANGTEALSAARAWLPDLVLTDVMMPLTDGITVCRELKSDAHTSHIIVVLLTALTHREAMIQGWEAKADDYLFKPFHPEELVARVRSLLAVAQERKRHQQELQQKNDELEHMNRELVRMNADLQIFSYSVSHDLKSPLRAIMGYTRILADEYGSYVSEEAHQMMNAVVQNTRKMEQLINGLIAFAHIDRQKTQKKSVDMTVLAHSVADILHATDPNVDIVIYPLLPALADASMMEHVLLNLIGNAVKYSSREHNPSVTVSSFKTDNTTVYCVTDNGVGFDMRYYKKLFGVFQRLHTADEFEGTGIGLALVKRIMEKHGGTVWATSMPGQGATFYFSIGSSA